MAIVQSTPDHVLDEATREALKRVNTTAVVDVLARNGYDARYTYMPNLQTMNPGERLVARAITVRFVPSRPDADEEKPGGEESPEYAAFELAGPGDVIVMESMRTKLMSIGGDIKFLRLKTAESRWPDLRRRHTRHAHRQRLRHHAMGIWQNIKPRHPCWNALFDQ